MTPRLRKSLIHTLIDLALLFGILTLVVGILGVSQVLSTMILKLL